MMLSRNDMTSGQASLNYMQQEGCKLCISSLAVPDTGAELLQ